MESTQAKGLRRSWSAAVLCRSGWKRDAKRRSVWSRYEVRESRAREDSRTPGRCRAHPRICVNYPEEAKPYPRGTDSYSTALPVGASETFAPSRLRCSPSCFHAFQIQSLKSAWRAGLRALATANREPRSRPRLDFSGRRVGRIRARCSDSTNGPRLAAGCRLGIRDRTA